MKIISIFLSLFILSGCATKAHFTEALLYKGVYVSEENKDKEISCNYESKILDLESQSLNASPNYYCRPREGSNPIYVDGKSVFKIELKQINPGWIHHDKSVASFNKKAGAKERRKLNLLNKGDRDSVTHFLGKELWVLTKIESVSSEDVLERSSKVYFKATSVKFNSESFAEIPLDLTETDIFTHHADSQYRITFKIYEIDHFSLKKALVSASDDNPGLYGVGESILKTLKSTAGGIGGSVVTNLFERKSKEPLFLERLLLEQGADLEFRGAINVMRRSGLLSKATPISAREYVLYDYFKSNPNVLSNFDGTTPDGRDRYEEIRGLTLEPLKSERALDPGRSTIVIKVTHALKDIVRKVVSSNQENFINGLKLD